MESSDALAAVVLALIIIICAVGLSMPSRGKLSKPGDIPSVAYVIHGIGSALGFAWDQVTFFNECRYVLRRDID